MPHTAEPVDDSRWEDADIAAALEHYLGLDGEATDALEARLRAAGVLEGVPIPAGADEATRFQILALAAQDVWIAERFGGRTTDAAHFARLRARFFAALRVLGENGAALERGGLVILDPAQPWISPLLAHALATSPVRADPRGIPVLVMGTAEST